MMKEVKDLKVEIRKMESVSTQKPKYGLCESDFQEFENEIKKEENKRKWIRVYSKGAINDVFHNFKNINPSHRVSFIEKDNRGIFRVGRTSMRVLAGRNK